MKYFIAIGSTILSIFYLLKFVSAPDDGTLAVLGINLFITTAAWAFISIERKIQ